MNKSIDIYFSDGQSQVTGERAMQWDFGRVLKVFGLEELPERPEIHMTTQGKKEAYRVYGKKYDGYSQADIPDILFADGRDILIYIFLTDAVSGMTVKTIRIPIQRRAKPEDYEVPEPDKDIVRELVEDINELFRVKADKSMVGTPLVASSASDMTNKEKIYVYTGTESGYKQGYWYYYDDAQNKWVAGGIYNATALGVGEVKTENIADGAVTSNKISEQLAVCEYGPLKYGYLEGVPEPGAGIYIRCPKIQIEGADKLTVYLMYPTCAEEYKDTDYTQAGLHCMVNGEYVGSEFSLIYSNGVYECEGLEKVSGTGTESLWLIGSLENLNEAATAETVIFSQDIANLNKFGQTCAEIDVYTDAPELLESIKFPLLKVESGNLVDGAVTVEKLSDELAVLDDSPDVRIMTGTPYGGSGTYFDSGIFSIRQETDTAELYLTNPVCTDRYKGVDFTQDLIGWVIRMYDLAGKCVGEQKGGYFTLIHNGESDSFECEGLEPVSGETVPTWKLTTVLILSDVRSMEIVLYKEQGYQIGEYFKTTGVKAELNGRSIEIPMLIVNSANLAEAAVKTENIATSAVTTEKLADSSITPIKMDREYTEIDSIYDKVTYVSDMTWESATSGWGEVQRDKSVGGATMSLLDKDGKTIYIEKGVGVHALSQVIIPITAGEYDYFESYIGIDQEVTASATNVPVNFRLYYKIAGDISWRRMYERTREVDFNMTREGQCHRISAPIPSNAISICLEAMNTVSGNTEGCHADWADAKFVKRKALPNDNTLLDELDDIRLGKADGMHRHSRVNGHLVEADVPATAVFTDTVTSVKGNEETDYRSGQVNLTPANIGAAPTVNPVFTGSFSHNRKAGTTVGTNSHAEGRDTTASGGFSHAEGHSTIASGNYSHAEGYSTTASSNYSHAEGCDTIASNLGSHTEGHSTTASGTYSHAEGRDTTASGGSSHAEGHSTIASGGSSHAEGYNTTASGTYSHSGGYNTTASSNCQFVHGGYLSGTAYDLVYVPGELKESDYTFSSFSGNIFYNGSSLPFSIGDDIMLVKGDVNYRAKYTLTGTTYLITVYNLPSGESLTPSGWDLYTCVIDHDRYGDTISSPYTAIFGKYNQKLRGDNQAFIIGNGTSINSRSNAFRVDFDGSVYAQGAYNTGGADYAEYFEWTDGNYDNEDRRGLIVTLDGKKIKPASAGDYILGVVSAIPTIIGNSPEEWHGKYLKDEFGKFKTEIVQTPVTVEKPILDDDGNPTGEVETVETGEVQPVTQYVINPEYDPNRCYIPRSERSEWAPVGIMGVLTVKDDGSSTVNGFCTVKENGIATASDTGYRVIARITENLIEVILK